MQYNVILYYIVIYYIVLCYILHVIYKINGEFFTMQGIAHVQSVRQSAFFPVTSPDVHGL